MYVHICTSFLELYFNQMFSFQLRDTLSLSSCRPLTVAFVTCVFFAASNSLRLVCFDRCHCPTRLSIVPLSPSRLLLSLSPPITYSHLCTLLIVILPLSRNLNHLKTFCRNFETSISEFGVYRGTKTKKSNKNVEERD